ncbi:MAG: LapA family protein [Acidobacteriota bacterium]|jgi:putative membrane protein
MKNLKLSAAVVLVILAIVLIMQNLEPVETKLLFVTMVMPRAALLAVTMLIGMVTGILLSLAFSGKFAKKSNKSQSKSVAED